MNGVGMMNGMGRFMNGNLGGSMGWIIWLVIIAVIGYFAVQYLKKERPGSFSETPLDILKKRYARGEITKEEFDKMKSDL